MLSSDVPLPLQDFDADLLTFYQAWHACRKDALIPALRDYLDAPVLRLQPFATIVDFYGATDIRFRLFGTGIAALAGHDLTKTSVDALQDAEELNYIAHVVQAAGAHPAGYISTLKMQAPTGLISDVKGLTLPVLPPAGVEYSFIAMKTPPVEAPQFAKAESAVVISKFRFLAWIDIGAGVPQV